MVSPLPAGFRLGNYTGISGQFLNNNNGGGSFSRRQRQSDSADNWGTDVSSK
jgi:hypothetical protein